MKKSAAYTTTLLLATLLLCLPSIAFSSSTGQQSRSHSSKSYPSEAQSYSHKPTTSILALKSLYPLHSSSGGGTASNDGIKDDFARLNKRKKYGGPITRDAVYEAVVQTKRQRPSQDIVVMGVSYMN
mmetsp:Transcript_13551/g.29465  ORF Transcript_13551/g.29465 Transcript_13551/m.29465 type:complete len:127 (+) Transcript_13551:52-432(+)